MSRGRLGDDDELRAKLSEAAVTPARSRTERKQSDGVEEEREGFNINETKIREATHLNYRFGKEDIAGRPSEIGPRR